MRLDSILLFPYYIVLVIRNLLYDKKIIASRRWDVPVISVGNITVGGTGKTPHSEMLIRLLKDDYRIAFISRGYKRKSKGYREVSADDSYIAVGDEPLQVKRKFPDITVAVDSSRKRAIETLLKKEGSAKPDLFILDDAFQHRKIEPALSILLIDYSRPIDEDHLLPMGRLRDLPSQKKRADIIIITKVPEPGDINPQKWRNKLKIRNDQQLLFSRIGYMEPEPVFPVQADKHYLYSKSAILFTGIANNSSLHRLMVGQYTLNGSIHFPDHHDFKKPDIRKISHLASQYPTSIIITTEKDAQRLVGHPAIGDQLKARLFYIPIETEIIPRLDPNQRVIQEELKEIGDTQFKQIIIKHLTLQNK